MFRISCPCFIGHVQDPLQVGTYWTPRWDAILLMAQSIYQHSYSSSIPKQDWRTRIYRLENAQWADPPKQHRWAFNYPTDAGEKVLVCAREEPKLLYDGLPSDDSFFDLMEEASEVRPLKDHSWRGKNKPVIYRGEPHFVDMDYASQTLKVYKSYNWQFVEVMSFSCHDKFYNFLNQCEVPDDWDAECAIAYAMTDFGWVGEEQLT